MVVVCNSLYRLLCGFLVPPLSSFGDKGIILISKVQPQMLDKTFCNTLHWGLLLCVTEGIIGLPTRLIVARDESFCRSHF